MGNANGNSVKVASGAEKEMDLESHEEKEINGDSGNEQQFGDDEKEVAQMLLAMLEEAVD